MLQGYGPALLGGLAATLQIAAGSLLVATGFGLLGAFAKLSANPVLRGIAATYTTLIRGVPELLLLLAVFYGGQTGLNALGGLLGWDYIDVNPFAAGVLTLGFIFGAYLTETFRGAMLAVPRGQAEAAQAFGFAPWRVLWRITLPQMVRHAIPGFANNWLVMLKAMALVSVIGLDDMVHRASLAAAATRQPFTFYAALAAIYLAITSLSLLALHLVNRRFSLGVRAAEL